MVFAMMAADALKMQAARPSAAMLLTKAFHHIPFPVHGKKLYHTKSYIFFGFVQSDIVCF